MTNLFETAAKFRDAFKYDPGHSDLDGEQPIAIHVTLGDWRALNYALGEQPKPELSLEDLNDLIKADDLDPCDDLGSMVMESEELPQELFDTGSVTIVVQGKSYIVSLKIEEEA